MIHVIAILTAKPGQRDALLTSLKQNIPTVRMEDGCIEYTAVVDASGTAPAFGQDKLIIIEKWQTMNALKAHSTAPHMLAFSERVKDIVVDRAIHILEAA